MDIHYLVHHFKGEISLEKENRQYPGYPQMGQMGYPQMTTGQHGMMGGYPHTGYPTTGYPGMMGGYPGGYYHHHHHHHHAGYPQMGYPHTGYPQMGGYPQTGTQMYPKRSKK